ncbi:MAG: hypothetical protein JRI23_20105 [Deltaproteobacteria bacterium]|jgi:hypothetical protein|nr:hypothetical protein [Deltaproteobacteria bacterium]MBW2534179.1 hypothetical protein [Deltaproteobacteria bacterium]
MSPVEEQTVELAAPDSGRRRVFVYGATGDGPGRAALLIPGLSLPNRPRPVAGYVESIARALAELGLVVVRGEPRWSRPGGTPLQELDWLTEVDDAAATLGWLKQQPFVEPSQLFIVGVSLGGVAAPLVAREAGGVAGIASWAATARPWVKYAVATLRSQLLWRGAPAHVVAQAVAASEWWHRQLRDTDCSAAELLEQNPEIAGLEVTREGCMGRPTEFWRQLCQLDSAAAYRELGCRVCTVRGSADFAAHAADQRSIVEAAEAAGLEVEAIELEGLDHLLRPAESARQAFRGRIDGASQYDRLAAVLARWMG